MSEQNELRNKHMEQRETMSTEQVTQLSDTITQHLLSMVQVTSSEWIYLYYQLGNEVVMTQVIETLWEKGKKTAFPKVCGDDIKFYEVKSFEQLQEGTFHVMEPDTKVCVEAAVIAPVILVPGVVFDDRGHRIGHGKGYYDRFLSQYPKALKIGVAYECQMADEIEVNEHDVPMDFVVTEEGIYQAIKHKKRK